MTFDQGLASCGADRRQEAADPASHLTELFRVHHMSLIRLALLMLGDQTSAEDVVQDVYARLQRRRRSRPPADLAAYARAAVLNACRSLLRRRALSSTGYWDTAGAGDNRTFFLTSVDYKRAIVSFYRLRLNADGHPQQLSELPRATLHNGLQGEGPQLLAATNGGTKLAYVTETGAELTVTHGGSSMSDDAKIRERIHIIDPRTGDQQAISLPQGTVIDELVWAPDGRALAFTEETPATACAPSTPPPAPSVMSTWAATMGRSAPPTSARTATSWH
jgi:DNA-directed RNA polymerase specialized sigma24 family protein